MKVLSREASNFAAYTEAWTVAPDEMEQRFRLIVTQPSERPKDGPLCGVIAPDGDANAGALVSAIGIMAPIGEVAPSVIVSIGYPLETPRDWLMLRNRELTPTCVPAVEAMFQNLSHRACPQTGGADAFLKFIEREVKPEIEKAHGVDPTQWTLNGISLGGLFTVHALLSHPGSFRRYNSISPSLWWESPLMQDRARALVAKAQPVDAAIYLSAGDQETRANLEAFYARMPAEVRAGANKAFGGSDMIEDTKEMTSILSGVPGLKVKCKIMENESHTTVYGVAISQGLRWLHHATKKDDTDQGESVQRLFASSSSSKRE